MMKIGKVLAVQHYNDTSFSEEGKPSVNVVIECGKKLYDTFKYGYFGEDLNVGDIVKFELSPFWAVVEGLKVLAKY